MNTADKFSKVFENALEVLDKIGAADHNPFNGHLTTDDLTKSRFFDIAAENVADRQRQLATLLDLVGNREFTLEPGRDGAVCIIFTGKDAIGTYVINEPIDGNLYTIEMVHGCLQAKGEGVLKSYSSHDFTVVLAQEPVKGRTEYALASVYPGTPDNDPSMPFDEGMKVHGIELKQAGITRVC